MLAVEEVPLNHRAELGLCEEAIEEPAQKRSETRDRAREEHPAGAEHAPRLGKREKPRVALYEVVQRTEQQDDVYGDVIRREGASVAESESE
jgi:hypothetical protein